MRPGPHDPGRLRHTPARGLALLALLAALSLSCVSAPQVADAAWSPAPPAPFAIHGNGYVFSFGKAVRVVRPDFIQFQFPARLRVASVKQPLYTIGTVFLLFEKAPYHYPHDAGAQDIILKCLGSRGAALPIPAGTTGFAYECRFDYSEYTCASDIERGRTRVVLAVTAPGEKQCIPFQRAMQQAFLERAATGSG